MVTLEDMHNGIEYISKHKKSTISLTQLILFNFKGLPSLKNLYNNNNNG